MIFCLGNDFIFSANTRFVARNIAQDYYVIGQRDPDGKQWRHFRDILPGEYVVKYIHITRSYRADIFSISFICQLFHFKRMRRGWGGGGGGGEGEGEGGYSKKLITLWSVSLEAFKLYYIMREFASSLYIHRESTDGLSDRVDSSSCIISCY